MQTRQHLEQLHSDLISPGEFDHNYKTHSMNLHPEKIKGHTNSAYTVFLKNKKDNSGTLTVEYKETDQLDRLIKVIKNNY